MRIADLALHDKMLVLQLERSGYSVKKMAYCRVDRPHVGALDLVDAIKRSIREADRDISMMTHGDIKHCEFPENNWTQATN